MLAANGSPRQIAMSLLVAAVLPVGSLHADDPAAAGTQGALRWTPHRAAATAPDSLPEAGTASDVAPEAATARPEARQAPARIAPAPGTRPAVDASVEAPMTPAEPGRLSRPAAPRPSPRLLPQGVAQAPAPWPSMNRTPGASPGTVRPRGPRAPRAEADEPTLFGINIFRSPQGEASRPILGAEGSGEGVRPAAAANESLRFTPRQVGAPGQRIARGPDGAPSVVARLPGSSMPTASTPRGRVPARRVSDRPTPAGELPPPAVDGPTTRSESGRPTPADGYPVMESPRASETITDDAGLSFGGADGDIGFGDMPPDMGGGYPFPGGGEMGPDGDFAGEGPWFSEDGMPMEMGMEEGPWYGGVQMHIPSFYDDPYACEDGEYCPGCYPWWDHDGRVLAFFRRLGRPYYGWRWYRDFTASAGVTSFQNATDFGLNGNYGFNEYLNWAMPFWNAFGVGWQVGVRGVQADFQQKKIHQAGGAPLMSWQSRNQVFLTTGFFTRAFEGRGLQGGAVWDWMQDDWFDTVAASQVRGEVSYVWGYNEFGFWGAFNTYNQNGKFAPGPKGNQASMDTLDLYTGFYRLQFGDANELKIWGGASGQGDNLLGALVRAPMSRSLALESTFTYLIPRTSKTVTLPTGESMNYSPSAWNVSANIVWYPACRARRSLASPYRPLFDVADNGSMITTFAVPKR